MDLIVDDFLRLDLSRLSIRNGELVLNRLYGFYDMLDGWKL